MVMHLRHKAWDGVDWINLAHDRTTGGLVWTR